MKEYTILYWIKFGKWKNFDDYPYLTVLRITEKQVMYSRANVENSSKNLVYRITLLNDNHYRKILLKQLNNEEIAHQEAEKLTIDLNLEKVIYSPG